jgi:ATP-dependent protease Clp ATPase subunit
MCREAILSLPIGAFVAYHACTTIEESFLDVMYEIPSLENVHKCIVDENVIRNCSRPLPMTVGDQQIPYAESA